MMENLSGVGGGIYLCKQWGDAQLVKGDIFAQRDLISLYTFTLNNTKGVTLTLFFLNPLVMWRVRP